MWPFRHADVREEERHLKVMRQQLLAQDTVVISNIAEQRSRKVNSLWKKLETVADCGRLVKGETVNRMCDVFHCVSTVWDNWSQGPHVKKVWTDCHICHREGFLCAKHRFKNICTMPCCHVCQVHQNHQILKDLQKYDFKHSCKDSRRAHGPLEVAWTISPSILLTLSKLIRVPYEQNLSEAMPSHQPDYFHPSRASSCPLNFTKCTGCVMLCW